ncbi:28S ribosomal protein S10, mitochondrial [Toxorhynchites rutilus septentrionalis]|uniref:28S ribosomal protein S10, mitochondrial n=1 Tax=Toxorhynchites rutilus septentrionalis TaxID=329112 RepID=UPI0024792F5E|nr:28S ribosomal protein S10, mitochondrial [Toxorhynchites rutilus septentrionalis]
MLKALNLYRGLSPAPLWFNNARFFFTEKRTVISSGAAESGNPDKLYSRVELQMKGIDPAVMKSYAYFAKTAAEHLDIEVGKHWALRKAVKDRLTLLKSVHIYKKHRVQYEIRNYYRFMHFHKLTGSTLDTFLEYVERNLPEGIALKVTKVELQELPEHLRSES